MKTNCLKLALLAAFLIPSVQNRAESAADDYVTRGIAREEKGDVEGAIAKFNRAIELNPKFANAYNNRGAAKASKGDLEGALADFRGDWISLVAGHLLGNVTETDLFAVAASPDAAKAAGQKCEASYYVGMKRLLTGDKPTAANYFRKCLATEQKAYVEYRFAEAELKALTP